MNLLRISLASLSIFLLIEKTNSSKELTLLKERQKTPLAVIKKYHSSELELAIPHKYKNNKQYVGYYYNDPEDDNDPKGKLMTACPTFLYVKHVHIGGTPEVTHELIRPSNQRTLLELHDYKTRDAKCLLDLIPSIRIFEKKSIEAAMRYCSKLQTEMYEVGYRVSKNAQRTDVQFLPVYKICYSKVKGKEATLYSIHRIESPSLLLLNQIKELPDLNPFNAYQQSILDTNLSTKKSFASKKYYAYQFVGTDDMPTGSWEPTTEFLFNYTPITKNADLFKGMIRADFYIRLYSKKNNKPLTLY
ncbi:uncharacterized protein LOC135848220 [Planococcus citri]|uniref:uncharacterized protein LOC135848220 n=1 Tax=Planococcus citri TaxID=170843 RepID=UPI0031F91668